MEASARRPYEVKVATEKAHETGLAGRYANAVFELAQEQGLVDVVAADFAALKAAMAASADLTRLVKSPLFSHEDQARALKPVLEKMGVNAADHEIPAHSDGQAPSVRPCQMSSPPTAGWWRG